MTTGRGKARVMYSVRIACPKCSVQQTFRGTPLEIVDALEMWNNKHQLTAHTQAPGVAPLLDEKDALSVGDLAAPV